MLATLLLVTYAMLAGADLGMTMACVGAGSCREVNPLLRPLQTHSGWYGATKAGLNTGVVMGVYRATRGKPRQRVVALVALVAAQAVIVGLNTHRLKERR